MVAAAKYFTSATVSFLQMGRNIILSANWSQCLQQEQ